VHWAKKRYYLKNSIIISKRHPKSYFITESNVRAGFQLLNRSRISIFHLIMKTCELETTPYTPSINVNDAASTINSSVQKQKDRKETILNDQSHI
jgi:hypothetical protein